MWEAQHGACCCYETTKHFSFVTTPSVSNSLDSTTKMREAPKCDFSVENEDRIKEEAPRSEVITTPEPRQ